MSGLVNGSRYLIDEVGAALERDTRDGPELDPSDLRRLAALSKRVERVFGSPQDVEWAIDQDNRLLLLQSRPVTTELRGAPRARSTGRARSPRRSPSRSPSSSTTCGCRPCATRCARPCCSPAPPRSATSRPAEVVVSVHGHVGIDLRLAGDIVPRLTLWGRLDPRPPARRLVGAWRVGRLRAALPRLAEHLLDQADADLEAVPPLSELTNRQIIAPAPPEPGRCSVRCTPTRSSWAC